MSPTISTSVLETTIVNGKTTEPYIVNNSSTVQPYEYEVINVISVSLFVIIIICIVIIVVILFMRKKRLDRLRHYLMPFYNFDPEEDWDWEIELIDDGSNGSDNRQDYKSIEHPQIHQTQLSLE